MINERQAHLLSLIVQEFIATAQPIASKTIVDKHQLNVSSATARTDMVMLEELGFLRQPHTSSGRVPTENGYRFYLEHFVDPTCSARVSAPLKRACNDNDDVQLKLRHIAKTLVELSGETAISSLNAQWNHYAGISKLFEKPDFHDMKTLRELSEIVDQFDDVLRGMYDQIGKDVNIWIGGENPFGNNIATILVQYKLQNGMTGLLGLVGPERMDYKRNIHLLTEAKNLLDAE